jgi:hypothetical protein
VQKDDLQKTVTLLANYTVLTFQNVSRPIRSGVNTVVGSTGYPIFSAKNLDDFLARSSPPGEVDELVLISASSKDYEFRRAIDFLDILVKLHVQAVVPTEQKLAWFADFYKDALHFLQGKDFAPLQHLLATPISLESLRTFIGVASAVAHAARLTSDNSPLGPICRLHRRENSAPRGHPKRNPADIGSIYHVAVRPSQRVVLPDRQMVVASLPVTKKA